MPSNKSTKVLKQEQKKLAPKRKREEEEDVDDFVRVDEEDAKVLDVEDGRDDGEFEEDEFADESIFDAPNTDTQSWDFSDKLAQIYEDNAQMNFKGTTLEDKIQNLLRAKGKQVETTEKFATTSDRAKRRKVATKSFEELRLSRPLLRALTNLGFTSPTPIQETAIPIVLMGKDIAASAATGSGKTAAFLLPTLERLVYRNKAIPAVRVLIILPTRELALQCNSVLQNLSQFTDITSTLIVGGLDSDRQIRELSKKPDIIVATPGRLIDHLLNAQDVSLSALEILILDEADRLLDMGFEDEVKQIVKRCPRQRQTLLFSATLTEGVAALAKLSLDDPIRLAVDDVNALADNLTQEFIRLRNNTPQDKEAATLALCRELGPGTLLFTTHKKSARRIRMILGLDGKLIGELHGDLAQQQRMEAMQHFKDGTLHFLVATDIAARGLDIAGVKVVVNIDMPDALRQYIHRVGRTARAGRTGRAISLVTDGDRKLFKKVLATSKNISKSRVVTAEVIAKCKQEIEDMEGDMDDVLDLELEEKELQKAEKTALKAKKLANTLDKPMKDKVWFQSGREKEEKQRMARKADHGEDIDTTSESIFAMDDAELAAHQEAEQRKKAEEKKQMKMNPPKQIKNYADFKRLQQSVALMSRDERRKKVAKGRYDLAVAKGEVDPKKDKAEIGFHSRKLKAETKGKKIKDYDSDDEKKLINPSGNKLPQIIRDKKKNYRPIETVAQLDKYIGKKERAAVIKKQHGGSRKGDKRANKRKH